MRTVRRGNLLSEPLSCADDSVHQPGQSRWWFVGAAVIASVLGLVSTRVGSVGMESTTSSDLRGLLGAMSAVAIMALGLQLVLVGILGDSSRGRGMFRPPDPLPVAGAATVAGCLCFVGALVFIDSSREFELRAALSIAVAVAATVASIPSRSVLLGEERWRNLALVGVLSSATRLIVTIAWSDVDLVLAVLGGLVAGEVVGATAAVAIVRDTPRVNHWPQGVGRALRVGAVASAALMFTIVLSSVSFGRFLGSGVELFNQSASVARLVFILAFTVAFVFFPAMARLPVGSVALRRQFHNGLLFASATAAASGLVIIVFPEWFLSLVGADASVSTTSLRVLVVAFALYGVAGVSLMQYIAHGSRVALVTVILVPVLATGHVLASSAEALSWVVLAASLVLAGVASLPALRRVAPVLRPATVRRPLDSSTAVDAVTVVIPSYNPGPAVVDTIQRVFGSFDAAGIDVSVIVVSDGSTDDSQTLIDGQDDERLTHVAHASNCGKGAALRTGLAMAETPVVCFIDADGDLPPSQLVDMARVRQERGADIVFGSKRHDHSSVSVPAHRVVMSRIYEGLTRHMFQLDIRDTQTGIKVFSRPLLAASLPLVEETGFALDLELFVAARANGFGNFVEFPVTLTRQGGSTVSARSLLRTSVEILRIFWRAKITLHYLRAAYGETQLDQTIDAVTTPPSAPTTEPQPPR